MMTARSSTWVGAHKQSSSRLYGVSQILYEGTKAWYYVLVEPVKEAAFLQVIKSGKSFTITDYGTVVASGAGEPDEATKQRMRDEFGLEE